MSIANYLMNINGREQIDANRDGSIECQNLHCSNDIVANKLTIQNTITCPAIEINGVNLTTNSSGAISNGIDGITSSSDKINFSKNIETSHNITGNNIISTELTADIFTLNGINVASKLTDVDHNKTSIDNNVISTSNNTTVIGTNTAKINNNLSKIEINTPIIVSNEVKINANVSSIANNSSGVASNLLAIDANTAKIDTNTTNIAGNTTKMTALQSDVNTNANSMSINTTNISNNNTSINQLGTKLDNFTIGDTYVSISKDLYVDDPATSSRKISLQKNSGKITSSQLLTDNMISNNTIITNILTLNTLKQNKNGVITTIDLENIGTNITPVTVTNPLISDTDINAPLYIDGDNLKSSKHINLKGDYGINNCKHLHFAGSSIIHYNTGNEIFNLTSGNGNSTLEFLTTKESKVKAKNIEGVQGTFDKIILNGIELVNTGGIRPSTTIEGEEFKIKAPTESQYTTFITYNAIEGLVYPIQSKFKETLMTVKNFNLSNKIVSNLSTKEIEFKDTDIIFPLNHNFVFGNKTDGFRISADNGALAGQGQ